MLLWKLLWKKKERSRLFARWVPALICWRSLAWKNFTCSVFAREPPGRHFEGKVPSRGLLLWEGKKKIKNTGVFIATITSCSCFIFDLFLNFSVHCEFSFNMLEGYPVRSQEIGRSSFQSLNAKFHQKTKCLIVTSGTSIMPKSFNQLLANPEDP